MQESCHESDDKKHRATRYQEKQSVEHQTLSKKDDRIEQRWRNERLYES